MKIIFKELVADIRNGKNIDVYVTIVINAVLSVLSLLDLVPFGLFSAVLLGSISWLVLNSLSERKEIQKQLTGITDKLQAILLPAKPEKFFIESYTENSAEFKNAFHEAKELIVIGQGQARMIITYGGEIQKLLANGGKIRFLLGHPDGKGTEMSASRSASSPKIENIRNEHWAAVERITSYSRQLKHQGNLEIRFIDLFFPYTMYGFDINDPDKGRIYIWITPYKKPSSERPGFVLTSKDNKSDRGIKWFDSFREQFESMWVSDETSLYELK